MKKVLLLIAVVCLPLLTFAQTPEKQHYIYNIVTFSGNLQNEWVVVSVDNGKSIEILRNEDGKKIKFKTPAAALMYFISDGWELYVNGNASENSSYKGSGNSTTTFYWIIRKPCSKEVFDKTVDEGLRK
jgi:hypothetical protein